MRQGMERSGWVGPPCAACGGMNAVPLKFFGLRDPLPYFSI